jgi:ABC-type nitrate/sulfonate/bicarbonate transport system substrate-binding protein
MMDDVSLGHIDAAGFAAYPIVFMSSRRATRPLYAATSLHEDAGHRLSYVLARSGSALRFPRDASGRRIGILPTIAYRRWLAAILRDANVASDAVTVVPVDPGMQAQALRDGAVDFMFTNDPMATAIIARGVGEVVDDGPPCSRRLGEPFEFGTFVLGGAFAEDRRDDAARVTAAIDAAIVRVREDPAAARRDMARHLRAEQRPFVDRYPSSAYSTTSETRPDLVAAEVQHERALGIIEREPEVRRWTPTDSR